MRGVIRAVWSDGDSASDARKRIWTHPEATANDIDLAVMTTNTVPGTPGRVVDFHELYWAHLMSETKAVAVLLWLFELARKGPNMKPGMNGLWWSGAIFVCLLVLSLTLLILQGVLLFSDTAARTMVIAPFLLLFSIITFGLAIALRYRALRLVTLLGLLCAAGIPIIVGYYLVQDLVLPSGRGRGLINVPDLITWVTLPPVIALFAIYLLMGRQGLRAFWRILVVSAVVFLLVLYYLWTSKLETVANLMNGWRPWSLNSDWSSVVAWTIVGFYLAVNAAFLQPYLGDAARYFRNSPANVAVRREIRKEAVELLDRLHESGRYDRIVVVAHSLGSVIAYDMLRAYFSRICDQLPPPSELGPEIAEIDKATWQPGAEASRDDKTALREKARKAIARIAAATDNTALPPETKPKSWLVTDLVTVGAALTHAHFLMCVGKTEPDLQNDFARRVREREFPTCPPQQLDKDGLLSFWNPRTGRKEFHHGALFGLTRWTNIYFPLEQVFWGDAIGGPLAPIFGSHIVDVPVATRAAGGADFFTHTAYWDVGRPEGWNAPHIVALRDAVDLADMGSAKDLIDPGSAAPAGGSRT
ncbi:MAG TPA: hypothetical protein VFB68_18195 [Xanthobacteraceae bacterium]|nr:hypothetical protein [Xanthobacteraceae bacterium]